MSSTSSAKRGYFLWPDESRIQLNPETFVGMGSDSIVLRQDCCALKIPKIRGYDDGEECDDHDKYLHEVHREILEHERRVYQRVGHFDGVARCFDLSGDGMLLEYYPKGDLEDFMSKPGTEVDQDRKAVWISSLLGTLRHFHKSKVLLYEMALRNILVSDDLELKMIDFGQCTIVPIEVDISTFSDDGLTIQADLFHMGCLIYSIVVWENFHHDLFERQWVLPPLDSLPATDGLFYGDLIRKCWSGAFPSAEQAYSEAHMYLAQETAHQDHPPNGVMDWLRQVFGQSMGWSAQ